MASPFPMGDLPPWLPQDVPEGAIVLQMTEGGTLLVRDNLGRVFRYELRDGRLVPPPYEVRALASVRAVPPPTDGPFADWRVPAISVSVVAVVVAVIAALLYVAIHAALPW